MTSPVEAGRGGREHIDDLLTCCLLLQMGLQKGATEVTPPMPATQPTIPSSQEMGRTTPPDTPLGGPQPLDSIAGPLDTSIMPSTDTDGTPLVPWLLQTPILP